MKALSAVKKGIGITSSKFGIVILLLLFNFIFALVLSVPMFYTLQDSFGDSMVNEKMAKGFDTVWYGEFRSGAEGLASSFKSSIIGIGGILDNFAVIAAGNLFDIGSIPVAVFVLGILYLITVTFLTGGVLGIFNEPERKFSFGTFFGDSGKYFIRFFIFTAGAVACYIVIVKYFAPWFSGIFESFTENAKEEKVPFFVERLKNIVFLIMLFFVGMVFDYSRILTVVDQRRNVIFTFLKSLYVIFRHIHRTFTIYYVLAFAGFVLIVLYWAAGISIPQDTFRNAAILFGIQQLYILLKLYLRCTFFTSQMAFYKGVSGKTEEVKKEIVPKKEEPSDIKEEYKEENNEPQEN